MLMQLLVAQEYFESACGDDQTRALIVGPPLPESMANSNFAYRRFDGELEHACKLEDVASFDCAVLPNRAVAERFCKFMVRQLTTVAP
jgi:hypothetical protein